MQSVIAVRRLLIIYHYRQYVKFSPKYRCETAQDHNERFYIFQLQLHTYYDIIYVQFSCVYLKPYGIFVLYY